MPPRRLVAPVTTKSKAADFRAARWPDFTPPLIVVMAAATNVGVVEGGCALGVLQEGSVEASVRGAGLQDRTDGSHGASADGDAPLASRIDALRPIGFDQGQYTQTDAIALFRMGAVGHHHLARQAATAGPVFSACASILAGVHSPNLRCAEGIWSATVA